jgi:DNA-binding response OmpR family regulator
MARVLIVDDEPYILRILAFKLRRAGYLACDAAEARAVLNSTAVQRIILDVSLPTRPTSSSLPRGCAMTPATAAHP